MKHLRSVIAELENKLAVETGPRGGKIIGKTKSGKPIYDTHDHPAHKGFTAEDHWDAYLQHGEAGGNIYNPGEEAKKHKNTAKGLKAESEKSKVIGKTRSGKPIYGSYDHPKHKNFSEQDHWDAAHLHESLKGKGHSPVDYAHHESQNSNHRNLALNMASAAGHRID